MRILVFDYGGYAFPVELSRWLAARGHAVLHLYSAGLEGPRGPLARRPDDPAGFAVEPVSIGGPLVKYDLLARWRQERTYGRVLAGHVDAFRPDTVLSANAPPVIQARLLRAAHRCAATFVCWIQDIFTLGVDKALASWPAPIRWAARRYVEGSEFGTFRASDALVAISPDFLPLLAAHGVHHPRGAVIENWAPKDDVGRRDKDNAWARRHGLANRFVFLFAGTLGVKHDPSLLADLATAFRDDPEVVVAVVSQGPGRRWLESEKSARRLDSLRLFDYQPYDALPDVLGSADVLVAVLEPFAGVLSVPSKVYGYFRAARPILASLPASNQARRHIESQQAGLCADPGDRRGFLAAARRLRDDAGLRAVLAANQRRYADATFDIEAIGPRFLDILTRAPRG